MSRYIYPVEYTFNQSYNEVINSIKSIFLLLSTKSPFVYNLSVLYQCDIYNELIAGTLFRSGTKATNLAMFIGTNPNSYSIGGRGSYKLNPEQSYEAYLGIEKFGKDSPATANCFFKGNVPDTPADFIRALVPFTPQTVEDELEDLYLYVRGSNESRGGSLFINRESIDSPWTINSAWKEALGISETKDKDGNIKYS